MFTIVILLILVFCQGMGGTFKDEMIVTEEMCYGNCTAPVVGVHSGIVMNYLSHFGTKEQKERCRYYYYNQYKTTSLSWPLIVIIIIYYRYLPDMASGRCVGAIAMTEPDAGSDLQGIRTR